MPHATKAPKEKRSQLAIGGDRIIKNDGVLRKRILIGIPTLGVVRIEWDLARRSLIIPINWSSGEIISNHMPESVVAQGYTTADAQNVCVEQCITQGFEWLLLYEDDVLPPSDAFIRFEEYMLAGDTPIISGLYFSKAHPTWPLTFRGRGNGCFTNYQLGDKVWCDGVPTGFVFIHRSVLEWFWKNTAPYQMPDGHKIPQIFEFPRKAWYDPEQDRYFAHMGTSDLYFCDRILKESVLEKTGWTVLAKKKYPFLVDTNMFCRHIDIHGAIFPDNAERILTGGSNGNHHKH